MPIVRQYDAGLPAYSAVLEFMAAQDEANRRQREARQVFSPDLITQLLTGAAQPQATPQQQASRGVVNQVQQQAAQRPGIDPRVAAAFYAANNNNRNRGNSDYAIASLINNIINGEQQAASQAAVADRQLALAQLNGEQDIEQALIQADLDVYEEIMGRTLPQEVQDGLNRGMLMRSNEQKRRLGEIQANELNIKRSRILSPKEKAALLRKNAEDYWNEFSAPQPNPNPPVPVAQQFEQETHVDEQGVRWTRGRQGEWTPRQVDSPEMEQRKLDAQIDNDKQKAATQVALEEYKTSNKIWLDLKPDRAKYNIETGSEEMGDKQVTFDAASYDRDYKLWLADRPPKPPWVTNPHDTTSPTDQPSALNQPQVDESGRVIVDSDDDARRMGLPDGTPIINSQGRTGVWYN